MAVQMTAAAEPPDASASAQPVVVGLDVGTTSAKAVAFDATGRAVGAAHAGYPLLEPEPGHAEQDPDRVRDAALGVVRAAAAAALKQGATVAGISISTAMHGLVGLDGEGRPLYAAGPATRSSCSSG